MNSKSIVTAGVVLAVGFLGAIPSQMAVAQPGRCQTAIAFESNGFGDCSPTLSIGDRPPSVEVYARRADMQIASAVAQYNTYLAANYSQRVANNRINETRVATANTSIQCLTNGGPARHLCQPGDRQVASQKAVPSRIARRSNFNR